MTQEAAERIRLANEKKKPGESDAEFVRRTQEAVARSVVKKSP